VVKVAQRVRIARGGQCVAKPGRLLWVAPDTDDVGVAEPPFDIRHVVGGNRRRDRVDSLEPECRSIPACRCGRDDVERAMNVPLAELPHIKTIETLPLDGKRHARRMILSARRKNQLVPSSLDELAAALVAIDSVNPALVPGGAGEGQIASFVADWCAKRGLDVEILGNERPSVVATKRGSGGGRSLLLNGHLDTVGVAGMQAPFEPRVEDGRLYGRGAYDMKGAVAAIMLAATEATGLRGDVIVTLVADEELASIGTEAVVEQVHADAAIVVEPTELRVAVAHRGFVGFELETSGVAAHGSRPDLGVDAIAKMGPILVALAALDEQLQAGSPHPLVGPASLHASLIDGGQELSSFPASCTLTGERRTIPGETVDQVEQELRAIAGDAELRIIASRDPLTAEHDHPFVELVGRVAEASEYVGALFWTDAALIAGAGIPTVLFGPAGEGAHAAVEWVDLASLDRVRDVALRVAAEWCA
jgi:acetylornithine deacetylase